MKKKLLRIIMSLIFPLIIVFVSPILYLIFVDQSWSKEDVGIQIMVVCPIIGGILSLLIMFIFKVDTSKYFLVRMKLYFIATVIYVLSIAVIFTSVHELLIYMPFFIFVIDCIYMINKSKRIGEILVMILSDPWLYYFIFIICVFSSINFSNGFMSPNG